MADPSNANLTFLQFWKYRGDSVPMASFACKKGGQENIGDKAMGGATSARMGSSAQGEEEWCGFRGQATLSVRMAVA
jgi:hypothetical protein